jgi:YggT family protein
MHPILALVYVILDIYKWVLIIYVVLDWLIAFNVINTYNRFVATVRDVLARLTEPVLRQIRGFIPAVGGIDLSPLVALIAVWFLQYLIVYYGH